MARRFLDDQTKALFQIGFVRWADALFALLIFGHFLTGIFWMIFGKPEVAQLAVLAISMVFFTCVWVVVLLFRTLYFVIQVRADIMTMPAKAARLAMQFAAGNGA